MRCSEAPARLRLPFLLAVCLTSLAVSQQQVRADDPPATEHETRKPQATNRLADETSPYLLQHAHNPVDWRPWGPDALQAAKDGNKPIFLSVGYSSCYWCHVMEREVFENEEIAAYLNEHFVCIKVDREERPDIDDQYMLALQLYFQAIGSPQGGGWPMSMFLTPDAKPFAGGTYFPAEDKPGIPGFKTVAEQIQTLWSTREADLRNNADFLASAVARHSVPGLALEKVELDESLVNGAVDAIMATCDPEHGGFYDPAAPDGPKFPEVPKLMLLANWVFTHDVEAESERVRSRIAEVDQALQLTLQRMAQGGMRDHIGGGFHRYSVDREWRVPHFEKMLYDQALLAMLYIDEFGRTDNPLYWQVATETLAFVQRELSAPEGGFYSSLDAETNGVEGQYYVWSRAEIDALLGIDDGARLFAAAYGLDEDSRFEHGHVLFNPRPLELLAKERGLSLQELDVRLTGARLPLLLERMKRPALRRDEKVLASWNGLMIAAFSKAAFWEPMPELAAKYANTAEQAANFVLNNMRDDEGRLLHCYAGGKAGIQPYLDDYAYVIWGLRELAEATQENATSDWQQIARELQDQQNEMFRDERGHGYFYTADAHEPLLARAKDSNDSVMPSANAVSVINLDDLSRWPGVPEYSDLARQSLEVFAPALSKSPALLASTADALRAYLIRPRNSDLPDNGAASTQPANDQLALAGGEELVPTAEASVEDARKHDKLSAAVYLSVDKVPAGGECNVAVVLNVKEGWHINANPAQPKFLIPTELTAALPAEFELTDVRYPDGEEFMQQGADEPLVVYEGKVVLYGKLKAPASAAGKSANSEFTVRYQCCNDSECLRPMKLLLKGQFAIAAQGEQPQAINQSLFKPKRPQPQ